MTSTEELKEVKQTMDQVTKDFFDTLESLYQSHAKLDSLMRSGFLSLSRSRYHMGGIRNVGPLQFDKNEMEMEALNVVNIYSDDDDLRNRDNDNGPWPDMEMKLVQRQVQKTTRVVLKDRSATDDNKANDLGLRQRKNVSKDDDGVEVVRMQELNLKDKRGEADGDKEDEKPKLKDPLTLFGVLISSHLRQCQASFKQAVEISVQIANTKHRLQGLQQKFADLQGQKEMLVAKARS